MANTLAVDHLHNYGPGTGFGASPARIGCACLPSESTTHIDVLRESVMFAPPSSLGQMTRPLTIGSWQKARGRGCNTSEVCARRLFFFRLHLEEHWGGGGGGRGVHAVCMRGAPVTIDRCWHSRNLAFLNANRLCPLFLSSTLSDERCSNSSFENPNPNSKNRT